MSLVSTVVGAGLSVATGGITGILGAGLQSVFGFLNKKQEIEQQKMKYENDKEMRQLDIQVMDKEWAYRIQGQEIDANAKMDVAESQAFQASVWKETDRYSDPTKVGWLGEAFLVALDVLKGIVRPALTIYLCAITTMIYFESRELVRLYGATMNGADAAEIYILIVNSILYLTTTVVLWWFGTRNKWSEPNKSGK